MNYKELADKLGLSYEDWMQDWPTEAVEPEKLDFYLEKYNELSEDSEQQILMTAVLQAFEELPNKDENWTKIKAYLSRDYLIHENIINYWSHDASSGKEEFEISPFLRELRSTSSKRKKVLFICTINRMRSATAQEIFKTDERFLIKSAGTDEQAVVVVTKELLSWADSIVVMERHHRNKIRNRFPEIYANKKIACLYIEDEYEFMQPELIYVLKQKFEDVLNRRLI